MQKKAKVAAGSAAALAILIAGGVALAMPAQASTPVGKIAVVEPAGPDTDNIEDGTPDATETGSEAEDPNDDPNGPDNEVEDGTAD